jgi:hypothetical protein
MIATFATFVLACTIHMHGICQILAVIQISTFMVATEIFALEQNFCLHLSFFP